MITLYGIPNCDTVKKARTWLTDHGQDYTFHDFKKQGVPTDLLPGWIAAVGLDTLTNRKAPPGRKPHPATQAGVVDAASATAVILESSSVIKRPLVAWADGAVTVGFSEDLFAQRIRQSHPG